MQQDSGTNAGIQQSQEWLTNNWRQDYQRQLMSQLSSSLTKIRPKRQNNSRIYAEHSEKTHSVVSCQLSFVQTKHPGSFLTCFSAFFSIRSGTLDHLLFFIRWADLVRTKEAGEIWTCFSQRSFRSGIERCSLFFSWFLYGYTEAYLYGYIASHILSISEITVQHQRFEARKG